MDKIINHKDGIFFKCKHLVHKSCFLDWSKKHGFPMGQAQHPLEEAHAAAAKYLLELGVYKV